MYSIRDCTYLHDVSDGFSDEEDCHHSGEDFLGEAREVGDQEGALRQCQAQQYEHHPQPDHSTPREVVNVEPLGILRREGGGVDFVSTTLLFMKCTDIIIALITTPKTCTVHVHVHTYTCTRIINIHIHVQCCTHTPHV